MANLPAPRVLMSIDYEPRISMIEEFESITDVNQRKELDEGFTRDALDPILEMLGTSKISFFLAGEIASWYPEVPRKIVAAGHELGLHCQRHRNLDSEVELRMDLEASESWRTEYRVQGFRAPRVTFREHLYPLLERAGLRYSSSIYATSGRLIPKGTMWEIPVSTRQIFGGRDTSPLAPRVLSLQLIRRGEIPFGSSFMSGIYQRGVLKLIEQELREGLSPALILHPCELVRNGGWPSRLRQEALRHPLIIPFFRDKSGFLKEIVSKFPTSSMQSYLDELLQYHEVASA
jgi:hypothetical protein